MSASPAAQVTDSVGTRRLAGAAVLLGAAFVASRLLGVVRNSAIATIFGNSSAIDAYFAAFRIPDTVFTLVSGAALTAAFIPTFAGLLEVDREDEAWEVASTVLNTLFLTLAGVAAVMFVFAPQLMDILVHGFSPPKRALAVDLSRVMLLQPIFLGLGAIVSAILQTYNRFAPTAIAPLVYNLAVIFAAVLFGHTHGVSVLAWAVVAGAIGYLLVQIPAIRPVAHFSIGMNWHAPAAREILRLLGPRLIGVAAFQAMILITLFLAASLPPGSVGAFNYAWPLIAFPVGALGTAAATAIFPTLSRLSATEHADAVRSTVNGSLRLILFLALPSAAGLMVLRVPVINVLYFHGRWTQSATDKTSAALLFFSLGIASLAAVEVFPRVFYAGKNTITPVRIAIVAVALDAGLGALFIHIFPREIGVGGLALATSIASTVQAVWLALALEGSIGRFGRRSILLTLRDALLASAVMALALYDALYLLERVFVQQGLGALITLAIELPLGLATFVGVAYLLGAPELWQVRDFVSRRVA